MVGQREPKMSALGMQCSCNIAQALETFNQIDKMSDGQNENEIALVRMERIACNALF